MSRQIEVRILGDASSLKRAFGQVDSAAGSLGSKLGGLAKGGLKLLAGAAIAAGAAAGAGLAATLKIGIQSLIEHEKADAQTAAALKSTGGAAKVTAGQIREHAGALEKLSGVDDVVIQGAQNLLLTFTNIRNEVGKGNDIFTQATEAALDMSVALGTDMSSASILVGKALNDPIAGLTALKRVGVSFTEAQREQIKAMVESGDAMGAQKLILAELTKEFGGSAEALGETFAGRLDILKAQFEELAEGLASKVMPYAEKFVGFLSDVIDSESASEALGKIGDGVKGVFDGIRDWVEGVDWGAVKDKLVTKLRDVLGKVGDALGSVDWGKVGTAVVNGVGAVIAAIPWRDVLSKTGEIGGKIVGWLYDTLKNANWGKVGEVIVEMLKGALEGSWHLIKAVFRPFYELGEMIGEEMGKGFAKASAYILDQIAGLISAIGDAFEFMSGVPVVGDTFKGWADGIDGAAKSLNDLADEARDTRTPMEKLKDQLEATAKAGTLTGEGLTEAQEAAAEFAMKGVPGLTRALATSGDSFTEAEAASVLFAAAVGRIPTEAETKVLLEDADALAAAHRIMESVGKIPRTTETKANMYADAAQKEADTLREKILRIPETAKTTVTTPGAVDAEGKLDDVTAAANAIPGSRRTSISTPGAGTAEDALSRVRAAVLNIPGYKSITVQTIFTQAGSTPHYAAGGVSPGGMALVGEQGPELVSLPRGARVYSNSDSRRIAARNGGGGLAGMTVNVHVAGSVMTERDLVRAVYDGIHAHVGAGNPSLWGARA